MFVVYVFEPARVITFLLFVDQQHHAWSSNKNVGSLLGINEPQKIPI